MGQVNHTSQAIFAGLASFSVFALSTFPLGAAEATVRMDGTFTDAGSAQTAAIAVSGRAGRFDRVAAMTLQIPLTLDANLTESGHGRRIVGSELFLKQSGATVGAPATDAREGSVPRTQLALKRTFGFDIDPLGPLAQNAIALCNGSSGSSAATKLSMSVPVLWRVTTGRFNFKWVNYDQVGPSDEIVSNPELYADRETHETDIAVSVPVHCDGETTVAAAPAKKSTAVPTEPVSNAMPVSLKASDGEEISARPVTVEASQSRTVCEGGMVRQTGTAATDVCLCPGNTRRVETGANAFSCERKVGRR